MRVAYFDSVGGAAGDMILGALLDAGLSIDDLRRELERLPLRGYHLTQQPVNKQHVAATQFLVHVEREDHYHHAHAERQDHHGHVHAERGDELHDQDDEPGRPLREILELVVGSALSPRVKETALRIFGRLGEAEARIHRTTVEDVHFHEVGATDSIVDIVGAAIAFELLGIERIYCSPLPLGSGVVETAHGLFPIPAPATLELIADARAETRPSAVHAEQVTPTGAAILTTLATFEQPPMRILAVGYGSGEANLSIPNVLRVWIGDTHGQGRERLRLLTTNVDDMNPEIYPYVVECCFQTGALDVCLIPLTMKKGRPGIMLEVLCRPGDEQALVDTLLRQTSTLGVRSQDVDRYAVERQSATVDTPHGPVSVKLKRISGRVAGAAPEYEDCVRVAQETGVPLVEVYRVALAAAARLVDDPA